MLTPLFMTLMLIPAALCLKKNYLFPAITTQALLIPLWLLKWLDPENAYIINSWMMLDQISTPLLILSTWVFPLMIIASQHHMSLQSVPYQRLFFITCSALQAGLMLAFTVTDMTLFYIMFETTLLPTLILITRWGGHSKRLGAGNYFLFYTLMGSLPLLIVILYFYHLSGHASFHITLLAQPDLNPNLSALTTWLACMLAFLIKMPLYSLHLWLPKAHVEAPIAGSMVLAAVLLKLGGYGMIRFLPMLSSMTQKMEFPFITLALWGMVMASLTCLRQSDMKSIIAYSSVSHMGLVISAILIQTPWSISGAMILMIAHGLTSSMLFCLANATYERTYTRTLLLTRGLQAAMPMMAMWWLLAGLLNMALPPTLNLLGELAIITAAFNWAQWTLIFTALTTLITAAYTLYLFTSTQHAKPILGPLSPTYTREHLLLTLHLVPLGALILNPTLTI